MDDLIQRLRDNGGDGPSHGCCQGCFERVMDEGADKIEQLQREVRDRDKVEYALRREVERLRQALDYFVGCSYPVAKEINPRGHNWRGEDALDFALGEAKIALKNG